MKNKFDRVFYSIAMFSGILLLALSFTIKQTNAACNDINCSLTNCVYNVEELDADSSTRLVDMPVVE